MSGRFAAALAAKAPPPAEAAVLGVSEWPGFTPLVEPDIPGVKPPRRSDPQKQREGMASIVGAAALRERLKGVAARDPDRKVREEATLAVRRVEQVEKK
jgi:hypothetical protein